MRQRLHTLRLMDTNYSISEYWPSIMCKSDIYLLKTCFYSCKNHYELMIRPTCTSWGTPKCCLISWRCQTLPVSSDINIVQCCMLSLQYPTWVDVISIVICLLDPICSFHSKNEYLYHIFVKSVIKRLYKAKRCHQCSTTDLCVLILDSRVEI